MLSFNHSIKVRYVETDAMQRVHHSNHLIWFEECRIELLNHMGIAYDQLEERARKRQADHASIMAKAKTIAR